MSADTPVLLLTDTSTKPTTTDANRTDLIYRDPNCWVDNDTYKLTKGPTVYVGMWWNDIRVGPGKEYDITTGEVVYKNENFDDYETSTIAFYHESLAKGTRYYENGKLVSIDYTCGRTSYFDDDGKLVRIQFMKAHRNHIEHAKNHEKHCQIEVYEADNLLRTEYPKDNCCHGEIHYTKAKHDGLTRVEFSEDHKCHGEIRYYVDNWKLTHKEYTKGHAHHGEIHYFDGNKVTRVEFTKGHAHHGEIHYFDGNKLTRVEFTKLHKFPNGTCGYNQIHYYDGIGKRTAIMFAKDHPRHGEILYYDGNKLTRIEYAKQHKENGKICYYDYHGDFYIEYGENHMNRGEIQYFRKPDFLLRMEYTKSHDFHGQIRYFNGSHDKLVRIEFSKDHMNRGEIQYFRKPNFLLRMEYTKSHDFHGQIRYFNGSHDKLVRVEHADGLIEYYENNKRTRIEYTKQHIWSDGKSGYGQIRYCDGDKLIRKEFSKDHARYGDICYYENNNLTRIEFSKDKNWHGEIEYYENNKLTRVEFSKGHICHGEIHYAKRGYDFYGLPLTRIEYSEDHQLHGEIRYYVPSIRRDERGKLTRSIDKLIRIENVSKDHGKKGSIDNLTSKKSKGPKSYCATCNIGSFVQRPDGWNCDNCFYKKDDSPNLLPESSGRMPTYYQDGEVPADKKRSEAETAKLMEERKARRNGTNGTDTSPKTSPGKAGKQKVSFADVSVTNPSKQLCNDIMKAEQRKMEKQCPGCGTWSSRTLGNNHISCECGIQFCFLCLTRVKGHKDAATGVLHFPTVCPQHGGDIIKPTAAALHKLASSAKCLTVSEACFSVETNAIELGTFTNHAKERAEERGVSTLHVQTTKKYGEEVSTMDTKGNPSVMFVHKKQNGKVLGKVYENEDGSRVKTVV
jgi:hypothetical protein